MKMVGKLSHRCVYGCCRKADKTTERRQAKRSERNKWRNNATQN